jgi:hypothetical protein
VFGETDDDEMGGMHGKIEGRDDPSGRFEVVVKQTCSCQLTLSVDYNYEPPQQAPKLS